MIGITDMDEQRFCNCARPRGGARDDAGALSVIHFELPTQFKASYVQAAQRCGMKLVPWIISALNQAADADQ